MKPIQYIIIAIFVVSGILAFLLFRQKSGRVKEQLSKKEYGWNPVAVKKMFIFKPGTDTLWLAKQNGVWQSNRHFDGMGTAQQLLIYMSTMQLENKNLSAEDSSKQFAKALEFCTFDKNQEVINHLWIGSDTRSSKSLALLNEQKKVVELSSPTNEMSLRTLLESFLAME